MTAARIAAGVQFTVDQQGQVTAVVIAPTLWQQIAEALEDADDREFVRALHARIAVGPETSGALRWREVADKWA